MCCLQMIFGHRIAFEESGINVSVTSITIGEGSYSHVLKGIDTNNFKKYAIKRIRIQSTDSEYSIKAEVEAFQRFKHSNIVPCLAHKYVIDKRRDLNVIFMVFPFIKNGNLREVLNEILCNRRQPFDLKMVLRSFKQIADALFMLHAYQPSFVHNDVKPEVSIEILALIACFKASFLEYSDKR